MEYMIGGLSKNLGATLGYGYRYWTDGLISDFKAASPFMAQQ